MKNILQLSVMSTEGKRTNGNEAWKRKIAQPTGGSSTERFRGCFSDYYHVLKWYMEL